MAEFPKKIWCGKSKSRVDLDCIKGPDHADWMAMLDELQATQSYILNLTGSVAAMPNITKDIHDARQQLDLLGAELASLTLPENLQRDLDELKAAIKEADVTGEYERLKRGAKKLFLRTTFLVDAYKKLKVETEHSLTVLTNSVRVNMASLRKDYEDRTDKLEEQIKELQDVLENPELE